MEELTITVFYSDCNDGYMYNVYDRLPQDDSLNCDDNGGLCTGSMRDAIGMATEESTKMEKRKKKSELSHLSSISLSPFHCIPSPISDYGMVY